MKTWNDYKDYVRAVDSSAGKDIEEIESLSMIVGAIVISLTIGNNSIDSNSVILNKFVSDRKHEELFDMTCCFADAPAHQHIEFQPFLLADFYEPRNIKRLEKRDHRHRRFHPHVKCVSTSCVFGFYFSHGIYIE